MKKDRDICAAATQGRFWYWEANKKYKSVTLRSADGLGEIVMDFVRYGMNGASPRFNESRVGGIVVMNRADKYFEIIPGREHHAAWATDLNHPDANFIAHFNPAKITQMLDEIERLKKQLAEYRDEFHDRHNV